MKKKQNIWKIFCFFAAIMTGLYLGGPGISTVSAGSAMTVTSAKKYAVDTSKYVMKNTMYKLGVIQKKGAVYEQARTTSPKITTLKKNTKLLVRSKKTIQNVDWYKVVVQLDNRTKSGYIRVPHVKIVSATAKSTQKKTAISQYTINLYRIADKTASIRTQVKKKSTVKILGYVKVFGKKWAKCSVKVNKADVIGYTRSYKVKQTDDVTFEKEVCDFPVSYRATLRALHKKYPKWKFEAVDTGLDWNTVVQNENTLGKCTIASYVPAGGSAGTWSAPFSYLSTEDGNYNWETDTFALKDSPYFYSAAESVIKYYLDPRNSLTEESIFQFESLAYDSGQTITAIKAILKGTFMSGSYSVKDSITKKTDSNSYAQAFLKAGKSSGVSAYFLASRARQELGTSGSGSVSGTFKYGGKSYAGYYNYYNIKASDSSIPNQNIANGLTYAMGSGEFGRPWSSITKSINGGAMFFAENYVTKGQNTVYFQKFNVVSEPLYWHQYMTAVQAPTSESKSKYKAYSEYDILAKAHTFYIPVYKNMPETACPLPASSGNSNSYIRSLSISNSQGANITNSVTPTFSYNKYNYEMVVKSSVSSISIGATPSSSRSSVAGTGTYGLEPGQTKRITLTCTAENGKTTTYVIKVARKSS